MFRIIFISLIAVLLSSCNQENTKTKTGISTEKKSKSAEPFVQVLGIAQDAGYPQIACTKSCCKDLWNDPTARKMVCSIALIDPSENDYWLFDASPDIKDQLAMCNAAFESASHLMPTSVFLTHAHIGHYTGLMQFGREALGGDNIPVYAMSRMREFLSNNGPWSQLVKLKNIKLHPVKSDEAIKLSNGSKVIPISVPHRDEFSETVGYKIVGPNRSLLFIPDIDKWNKWDRNIKDEIAKVDIALLDGSFFANGEIFGRDMSLIPHPFIQESMSLMKDLPDDEKSKVHFIHLNHTNPILRKDSDQYKEVIQNGFNVAEEGQKIYL